MSRPFATVTRLGKRMVEQQCTAADLSRVTGIYPRTLTELLAGRQQPHDVQLASLAEALECDPEDLLEPPS